MVLYKNEHQAIRKHLTSNNYLIKKHLISEIKQKKYTEFSSFNSNKKFEEFVLKTINNIVIGSQEKADFEKTGIEKVIFQKTFSIVDATEKLYGFDLGVLQD